MRIRTNSVSGTIFLLIGFVFIAASAEAQELAWYQRAAYDVAAQVNDGLTSMLGVEDGVVVGGPVNTQGRLSGKYIRRVAGDGTELWRLDIPLNSRESSYTAQMITYSITENSRGGWWLVTGYSDRKTSPQELFFLRHRISPDGRLSSTTEGVGGVGIITPEGRNIVRSVENDTYVWQINDIDAGSVDSVSFDMGRILGTMRGEPVVAWNLYRNNQEFFLLSDGILGECVLVSVDLRNGRGQVARLDDIPTAGLSGMVTGDGSVVVLGRETRWREGELHDLVLIRPGIEGQRTERTRLPINSAYSPTLYGTLGNGDIILSPENKVINNRIYRVSPDGSSISYLQLFGVSYWSLSIAPDDAMYVNWGGAYFGKVTGTEGITSVSDDEPPANPWLELDLSQAE